MKRGLLKILLTWVVSVLILQLCRLGFIAVYHGILELGGIGDVARIACHGLAMDCSVVAYLTVIPALLVIARIAGAPAIVGRIERWYYVLASLIIAVVTLVDAVLYGYWDFRLDMTPIFYLTSSPEAAMASAEWWMYPLGLIAIAALTALITIAYRLTAGRVVVTPSTDPRRRGIDIAVATLAAAALFIPMRGGFTVSTMNLSRAYFSSNLRHNHAAINPLFSLLYSATHGGEDTDAFEYFDTATLDSIMAPLGPIQSPAAPDTALLTTSRPDVYLIILESFSAHLLPSLGGEPIATSLDSIARDGILFTRFYGSSFRTDRALPAILSAFPGQPTTSIMKSVDRAGRLPSIARVLNANGYQSSYYYGGDLNFTNMLAYLINGGYSTIVGDRDFPVAQRLSKWGAHDEVVFDRAFADARLHAADTSPRFVVIQTSSSHEPFEVPRQDPRFEGQQRQNAFAYTDRCVAAFVDSLATLPSFNRSLVIIVPDHQGGYPPNLDENAARHHLPLILTGSALARRGYTIPTVGSQVDIAATVLGALGIDHSAFPFSKNMLDDRSPRFAFFTSTEVAGFVDADGNETSFNIDAGTGEGPDQEQAKAMLQSIYRAMKSL
ncbi:MAG: LTA synthase family protein [Muribaculaceae bacterium]|nr:LTA synthase family protein [Muribaculaceae bacterium]